MTENTEKKHPAKEFVKTYPRFIPFCIIVVTTITIAAFFWDNITAKWDGEFGTGQTAAYEETVRKAEAEKQAAQLYKEAAELYAEAISIRSEAEAKANRIIADSLTEDLMEYFRYRDSLKGGADGKNTELSN